MLGLGVLELGVLALVFVVAVGGAFGIGYAIYKLFS